MNKVAFEILNYQHISALIISTTLFQCLVTQIVREARSDFHMQKNVLKTFQLKIEIFMMTFFADIVTFYLSLELITYHSISATNLSSRHTEQVMIMNKDILHVC